MIGAKYDWYNHPTFSDFMQFKAGIVSGLVFAAACFGTTASASSESLSIESTQESIGFGNCSSSDDFIECMNQMKLRRDLFKGSCPRVQRTTDFRSQRIGGAGH